MDFKCSCGSANNYLNCCGKYINKSELPITPEQLMRSRYTAYATGNMAYIANTMCGKTSGEFNKTEALSWAKSVLWDRLEILNTQNNAMNLKPIIPKIINLLFCMKLVSLNESIRSGFILMG